MTNTKERENDQPKKFSLGIVLMARLARHDLSPKDVLGALIRHADGDWGDVCEEDRLANENALLEGTRLFSVYHTEAGRKFWIITEADRSATTILLPEEY